MLYDKHTAARGRRRSSRLYRFDLDCQLHLLSKSHLAAEADSEVATIECSGCIRAADLLLGHRIQLAQKTVNGQRERFRDAMHCQFAANFRGLVPVESRNLT